MSKGGNPRRKNSSLRNKLRNRLAQEGRPCAICGAPIDYSLKSFTVENGRRRFNPWSYELDEIIPVSRFWLGGYRSAEEAAMDPNNHQPVHRICNQKRGNKLMKDLKPLPVPKPVRSHSRSW